MSQFSVQTKTSPNRYRSFRRGLGIVFAVLACGFASASQADTYSNPIISGMNPDPSICRVGEDYYLVTSTFGFFPGIPVYHSRDLVNWKHIGYGLTDPAQLNLKSTATLNIFAATIRYHKGTFYIITTNTGQRQDPNFVITAKNPAGPWSKAHFIPGAAGIDPDLFFDDDGKVYYTGNDRPAEPEDRTDRIIWTQELDTKNWKLVGEKSIIIARKDFKQTTYLGGIEAPHIYKRNGIYYVLLAHGGTDWGHSVSMGRSKNITGPYEMSDQNPIVTHRDLPRTAELHKTGHADLIQTQNGEWWMVLLASRPYGGDYTNLGRESCLVPVDWSGTWPVVNPAGPRGRVLMSHKKPNLPAHPWPAEPKRDDFNDDTLKLYWNFIQTPKTPWWSLNDPKGALTLKLRPEQIDFRKNPSFVGRRQAHKNFTAITQMNFVPQTENEVAGLVITRDVSNQFHITVVLKDGKPHVQLYRKDAVKGTERVIAAKPVESSTLYLKMEAREQLYSFSYSEDGTSWETLATDEDGSLLSFGLKIGKYTGTFVGMYATSKGEESANHARFDWFEYEGF